MVPAVHGKSPVVFQGNQLQITLYMCIYKTIDYRYTSIIYIISHYRIYNIYIYVCNLYKCFKCLLNEFSHRDFSGPFQSWVSESGLIALPWWWSTGKGTSARGHPSWRFPKSWGHPFIAGWFIPYPIGSMVLLYMVTWIPSIYPQC